MLNKERQDQVVALCSKLIQQKSYSGGEGDAAKALTEFLKQAGLDSVMVDKYSNVIGCIKGNHLSKKAAL